MKTTYITCEQCNIHYPTELMVRKKSPNSKEYFICLNCEFEKGKKNTNKKTKEKPKSKTTELTIPPAPEYREKLAGKYFFGLKHKFKGAEKSKISGISKEMMKMKFLKFRKLKKSSKQYKQSAEELMKMREKVGLDKDIQNDGGEQNELKGLFNRK